jgi:hypothetical protein
MDDNCVERNQCPATPVPAGGVGTVRSAAAKGRLAARRIRLALSVRLGARRRARRCSPRANCGHAAAAMGGWRNDGSGKQPEPIRDP